MSFANAYGKTFVQRFHQILVSPVHKVLLSTNLRGKYQPGSMSLEWVVGEVDPQPHVELSSPKDLFPQPSAGPGERPNKHCRRWLGDEERVADIVILEGKLVTTVFEIKSDRGGVSPNKEANGGAPAKGPGCILGIVLEPGVFQLNLFVANHQQKIIHHYILKDISLRRGGLVKLARQINTWSYNGQPSLPATALPNVHSIIDSM